MFKIGHLFSFVPRNFTKKAMCLSALLLSGAMTLCPACVLSVRATQSLDSTSKTLSCVDINNVSQWPQGPSVAAESAILLEAQTGTILYAKNIHEQQYPASCTKILTCLIAAECCEPDELVYMSHDAIYDTPRGSNHIALDVGEAITMEQALSAILIRSANEVSFAVGEHISGTTWQDFGPIMTQKAQELGCLNSNFINPNGLPDDNHYTTAYDLATIARYFFDNELLSRLSRTTKLEIPISDLQPDHIVEHTKNRLLPGQKYAYEYLVGSKTGYTDAARNCLVSCAQKDGLKLICVVLRDSSPEHYTDTLALFDWGFSNFKAINISENETKYQIGSNGLFNRDNDVLGNSKPLLELNKTDFIVLPNTASFEETDSQFSINDTQDNKSACITYTWNDVVVGTASVDFNSQVLNDSFPFQSATSDSSNVSEETDSPTNSEAQDHSVLDHAKKGTSLLKTILKILLVITILLVLCSVLIMVIFYIRNYRRYLKRSRRYHAKRHPISTVTPKYVSFWETVRENAERRRRYRARKARLRQRKKSDFSGHFKD